LSAELRPDPLGSLQRSPRLPSWIMGDGRGKGRKTGSRGGKGERGGCKESGRGEEGEGGKGGYPPNENPGYNIAVIVSVHLIWWKYIHIYHIWFGWLGVCRSYSQKNDLSDSQNHYNRLKACTIFSEQLMLATGPLAYILATLTMLQKVQNIQMLIKRHNLQTKYCMLYQK